MKKSLLILACMYGSWLVVLTVFRVVSPLVDYKVRSTIRQEIDARQVRDACEVGCERDADQRIDALQLCYERCYIGWKESVGEK